MWHPHCAVDVVMDEALATAEGTFRPGTGLRQVQRPIVNGPVLSRARDLDDLQAFQNLEHLVANLWWLKHTISSLHYKLWPALVNKADPAFVTVDHLELDPVEYGLPGRILPRRRDHPPRRWRRIGIPTRP